jgi:hypothetical protein
VTGDKPSGSTCAGPHNLGKSLVAILHIILYYCRFVLVAPLYARAAAPYPLGMGIMDLQFSFSRLGTEDL